MTFETVRSEDGSTIAFERTGTGPALVLVGGAFCGRGAPASGTPLAALLADRFTVFSYDRRGRGDSAIAAPWKHERELEDLAAVIEAAGGSAFVFGNSSGGLLALDAAAHGLSIPKLALYEPPVILEPSRMETFFQLVAELDEAIRDGRRDHAVTLYFTKVMQMPESAVASMRHAPMWAGLMQIAHTLSYDLRITARGSARTESAKGVVAETLVLTGSASPPWMRDASATLASGLPIARTKTLEGQTHAVDTKVLASTLADFFAR